MSRLDESHALVTGAASGIGRVFAVALAGQGAAVSIADIQGDEARSVASEIAESGGDAVGLSFDQSDPKSVDHMFTEAEKAAGPVDILVNNASLFAGLERKPALEIDPEEWSRVIDVNLNGVFHCCRRAMPAMINAGYGKIVNISSGSIFAARNNLAHYVAAKAGIVGLTRALAREYGPSGIYVNALSPGSTDSGTGASSREYLEARVPRRSIQRVEVPEDLVGPLLFLCSDESDFVTGQNIIVDGGIVYQ